MRTLGGGSPLATVRGAATKYASSDSSYKYSPFSGNKNSEVYSDSESDAEQTGGGDGRRGREATPGFRLYDGLTRADGDDDKENRYDDRYDDRRDDAKTPNEPTRRIAVTFTTAVSVRRYRAGCAGPPPAACATAPKVQ